MSIFFDLLCWNYNRVVLTGCLIPYGNIIRVPVGVFQPAAVRASVDDEYVERVDERPVAIVRPLVAEDGVRLVEGAY